MKQIILFFLVQISLLLAWADCPTYDLSDAPGFRDRTQTYQGDIGWCFAFSRADIVSQKVGVAVSPIDIAIRYFGKMGVEDFDLNYANIEGGRADLLNKFEKEEPYFCEEANYASENNLLILPIYEIHASYVLLSRSQPPGDLSKSQVLFKNVTDIPNLLVEQFGQKKTKFGFFQTLNERNCIKRIDAQIDFEMKTHNSGWDDEESHQRSLSYIIDKLHEGKLISAAVDSTRMLKSKLGFFKKLRAQILGNHQTTVIGMSEENGQCYVSIRDSSIYSREECENLKADPRIICTEKQNYKVPADTFLNALKETVVTK